MDNTRLNQNYVNMWKIISSLIPENKQSRSLKKLFSIIEYFSLLLTFLILSD